MKSFPRQSQSNRTATAWLLIGVLLLQSLVTFLASPWFTNDGEGRLVVVCTLYGLEEIYVEDGISTSDATEEHCPALELMKIASSAYQSEPPRVASALFYSIGLADQTAFHQHHSLHYSAYHTRAPPVA